MGPNACATALANRAGPHGPSALWHRHVAGTAPVRLGCNHPIGPLALADLIGLDTMLAVMRVFYDGFNDPKYRPAPLLTEMVAAGYLGRKTGRGFYRYP